MNIGNEDAVQALEGLGFTGLEGRIYVNLLRHGPLTGYRIAQHIGKAAANTYKALEALERRGAVVSEDSGTRAYRAVPYSELVAMLSSEFSRRSQAASVALATIQARSLDDRVYRLANDDAIYERARSLIDGAHSIVVIDAFPAAIDQLRDALEACAARCVQVIVHAYARVELSRASVVLAPNGDLVRSRWPGTWLNLCCDADAALIAHLTGDERTTGMWTQNPYVSWILYGGIASETAVAALREMLARDPSRSLASALADIESLLPTDPPGRSALYSSLVQKDDTP